MDKERFIKKALKPVGHTMYVLGGGWNEEDTGAGETALSCGEGKLWRGFFEKAGRDYDYKKEKAPRECGLDCTGFVGWAIYNSIAGEKRREGYVFKSDVFGQEMERLGLGEWSEDGSDAKRGDIMCKKGHVWICLGVMGDGSRLILHSSPPGVCVCGAPEGSMAHRKADEYMRQYPEWYGKFPVTHRGEDYLTGYGRVRIGVEFGV
ncbi:MAG: hypothetical protein LUG52_03900 [Clostridia bacterium]|nr:hypothetical protein [Clostridia bacterium]